MIDDGHILLLKRWMSWPTTKTMIKVLIEYRSQTTINIICDPFDISCSIFQCYFVSVLFTLFIKIPHVFDRFHNNLEKRRITKFLKKKLFVSSLSHFIYWWQILFESDMLNYSFENVYIFEEDITLILNKTKAKCLLD